jgi:hypothetical protein
VAAERVRAWPDDRHLAAQHVQNLRQFVDARFAYDGTYTGDPVVVARSRSLAARIKPFLAHRTELEHVEELVAAAHTSLHEQHWPAVP